MEHFIIDSWKSFKELQQYVKQYKDNYLVFDTETNNKVEKKATLWGIGLSYTSHESFYIGFRSKDTSYLWPEDQETEIIHWLISQLNTHKLIAHNGIYDLLVLLYNWDVDLTEYLYSDTILQKHLLDEERPFGLKECGIKFLGSWADKAQEKLYDNIEANGGSTTKDNIEMWKADTEILGEYCCWDTMITYQLFELFEPQIKNDPILNQLFYIDETMPLYKECVIPMKIHGFPIDVQHFEKLKEEITKDIEQLEYQIQKELQPITEEFCTSLINKDYPISKKGNYPKIYAERFGLTLPTKNEKVTLAKKELEKFKDKNELILWLLEDKPLDETKSLSAQYYWHRKDKNNQYVFNLLSNNHLKWLFFENLNHTPLSYTEAEEPSVDDDFFESIKDEYKWMPKFIDYKKLNKLKSTYVEGILEQQIDGVIYTSFLVFGTTSGRFSSKSPNLQNLPRLKEEDSGLTELVLKYVNAIKRGFVASKGNLIVDADYSQLEPRCFAEACNDYLLQKVFIDGEDLYGSIAKRVRNLSCTANEVKKLHPEFRQEAKIIALAVVYGAEAGRISQLLKCGYEEAQQIINDYLDAYPGLRQYMDDCNKQICTTGQIATKFGRIRHLPEAKKTYSIYGTKILNKKWAKEKGVDELRWKFKNALNLAKNHKIQGIASHIVNRAMLAVHRQFKKEKIDAYIVVNLHDQISCISTEKDANRVKEILKDKMENNLKLRVPLKADPIIAYTWDESK